MTMLPIRTIAVPLLILMSTGLLAQPDTWVQRANYANGTTVELTARNSAVGFSIGTKGYITTGLENNASRADLWEYDPALDVWERKADFGGGPRYGAVGFTIGTKAYVGTGWGDSGELNDLWEYDPANDAWTQKADLPGAARYMAVGFSIGNKGYIGTGYSDLGDASDFWEYDPTADAWTQISGFTGAGRYGAIAFGIDSKGYVGTGSSGNDLWEYDPSNDMWSEKAALPGDVFNGAVGLSIGSSGLVCTGTLTNEVWKYEPATDSWTQMTDFPGAIRSGAVGFSIAGKGYIGMGVGIYVGDQHEDFLAYDSSTDGWTPRTGFRSTPRYQAVGFSIGNKAYVGLGSYGDVNKKEFWEYDPATDLWTRKADFGGSARTGAVAISIGGKGYVGTGGMADWWEYDPANDTWTQKADFGGGGRTGATGFSIGNKGYVGTGSTGMDKNGFSINHKDLWEYDPGTDTWTQKADLEGLARYAAAGFSIGDKGYIGTGHLAGDFDHTDEFWEYDPVADDWTQKADFAGVRSEAVGFSIGSKGYIGTGLSGGLWAWNDFWEFDPASNTWTEKAICPVTRYGAVGFSIGGKGYIGLGNEGDVNQERNDLWEYTPGTACMPSQLTTTADPVISCGAMNLKLNGTSTIAATEVPGANRYQFRFTNITGQPAYSRNIAWPTRSFTLTKWGTNPLKAGRTYNAVVRASFDDGATWCDYGPSCTVKVSWTPMVPGMEPRDLEVAWQDAPELLVYPNPTNGANLRLRLTGIDPGLATVTLDITDLFGKSAMTATLPINDGELDTGLSLNGDLSSGVYIARITAGRDILFGRFTLTR